MRLEYALVSIPLTGERELLAPCRREAHLDEEYPVKESNPQPSPCKGVALPVEPTGLVLTDGVEPSTRRASTCRSTI